MTGFLKMLKGLCNSARLFLAIAVLSLIVAVVLTLGYTNQSIPLPRVATFSVVVAGYTYVLNKTCKSGYKTISWILTLIPLLGLVSIAGKTLLGMIGEELISVGEKVRQEAPVSISTTLVSQ